MELIAAVRRIVLIVVQVQLSMFGTVSGGESEGRATNCDSLNPPEFGNVEYYLGEEGEQKAVFTCTDGYTIIGASQLKCLGDHWSDNAPICHLGVFDDSKNGRLCHLGSSDGCKYVNDARNPVMWRIEKTEVEKDGAIHSTAETLPTALLRCEPQFCPKETSVKRRRRVPQTKIVTSPQEHKIRRHGTFKKQSTHLILSTPNFSRQSRSIPVVTALESFVEVGKFIKSPKINYLKFTVTGARKALNQVLYVVAHCLPDPPGHLDHLSPSGHTPVSMILSGGSQTKCLKLKDRVRRCNEFSIRFSVYIQHYKSEKIRVSLTPQGIYPSLPSALCTGKNVINP